MVSGKQNNCKAMNGTGHDAMISIPFDPAAISCDEALPVSGHAPSLLPSDRDFRLVRNEEFDGENGNPGKK